jgi:hypothetical protein
VLGEKACGPRPAVAIAAIAGEFEGGQAACELAQENDAGGHGECATGPLAAGIGSVVGVPPLGGERRIDFRHLGTMRGRKAFMAP